MLDGITVDLFAGGGGASVAIEAATGRAVDVAINHNDVALAVHEANHPGTKHFVSDIWEVEPLIATRGKPVALLWASPSCTHFSRARSGVPRSNQERSHADVVIRWAEQTRPAFIFLENVSEFLTWGPLDEHGAPIPALKGSFFLRWKRQLEALGYSVDWRVLDSAAYGAPTRRRRLYLVARRDGQSIAWPSPTHGPGMAPLRTAAECLDWSIPAPSIFGRSRPLAEKTLARIAEGIRRFVLDTERPFIVAANDSAFSPVLIQTGYGERQGQTPRVLDLHDPMGTLVAGGVKQAALACFLTRHFTGVYGQELDVPMSTITATDHHALTALSLAKFRGTSAQHPMSCDPHDPLPTISAGGVHVAAVATLLTRFGVTPKPIFVNGHAYGIGDIGMRMLKPHELLRAQFGRFAEGYDLGAAKTDTEKVKLIGNSVPPECAMQVILANIQSAASRRAESA